MLRFISLHYVLRSPLAIAGHFGRPSFLSEMQYLHIYFLVHVEIGIQTLAHVNTLA